MTLENGEIKRHSEEFGRDEMLERESPPEPPLIDDRGGGGSRQPFRLNMGGGLMQQIIVTVVVVVLLVFIGLPLFGGGSFVTKKDFETNLANVSASINQVTADVGGRQGELNAAIQGIPATVNNAVNQAVGQQLTDLSSAVSSLSSRMETIDNSIQGNSQELADLGNTVATYSSTIESLKEDLEDMEERIEALESGVADTDSTTSTRHGVTATIRTISNTLIASSNTTMSGSIRVEISNTTTAIVKDIVLEVSILTDIIQGYTHSSLAGGGTIWQGQGIPWNMMSFMNTQWGLNLAANETKVLYLTYTVTGTNFMPQYETYGVPFQVNVDVI